ncbi:MAG: amino acid decarboxylase [Saprospiraceae bacterium]|nr:amino acid decarboxylase [Saprospiraceae bacterium]
MSAPLDDLRQQINALEIQTNDMDPSPIEWGRWLDQMKAYTDDFLIDTRDGPAYRQPPVGLKQENYPFHLSETGVSLSEVLSEMHQMVDYSGLNPASGGHLAYIPGGGVLPSALGDLLAAVTNRYAGVAFANPGAVALEHFLIRWMTELFGFPATTGGNLSSGGSIANLIAITTARDARQVKPSAYERLVIYGSERMHHCLHKALRIAGLGFSPLREIELDDRQRMIPEALEVQIIQDKTDGLIPFLIIGSAGTTDTGSIDPLDALADLAERHSLWFHIDAAYGGFFYLVPEFRSRLSGISRAHSLVIDPHKGLFLPYGTGAVLIRDIHQLHASQYYQANYMQDAAMADLGWSPADLSPELTKHFRGLRMYFALKMFGIDIFRNCLKEKIFLCQYFHLAVQDLGFEVGPDPELSVTHFRWAPVGNPDHNAVNRRIMDLVHADGRVFLSSTTLNGQIWIRFAVLSFRTKFRHISMTLELLQQVLNQLSEND